jgi:hypothetical protein
MYACVCLCACVSPCRLLLNCVGPFRYWGEPVFTAAAAAGTDYLDIAGEPGELAEGGVWDSPTLTPPPIYIMKDTSKPSL